MDGSGPHCIVATGRSIVPSELKGDLEDLISVALEGLSHASSSSPSQGSAAVLLIRPLRGVDFPASKHALLQHAHEAGASREVLNILQRLEGRRYRSMGEVARAIQKGRATAD